LVVSIYGMETSWLSTDLKGENSLLPELTWLT